MIEPGKITIELLLGNPATYMGFLYVIPLILGALSAYFADRSADATLKNEAKESQPDISKEKLNDVYEFENIRDPIAWGMMAVIVIVYPVASTLDAVGDWAAVWSSAVLAGLVSRVVLMRLAASFITKVNR